MKWLIFIVLPFFIYANEHYKIGVLFWSETIEGQVAMKKGLEKEAELINQKVTRDGGKSIQLIPFVAGDGEEGMENQLQQFYQLLSKNVDAIIVQPTDNAILVPPLLEANKKLIPVIAYDQYISQGKLESFITSDNYQAGFLAGEYISDRFKNKNSLKIALVEYPHVSSTVQRVDGFIDALETYKIKYKILKRYEAVEPVAGAKAGLEILKDFPQKGSLDLIFTVNDGGGVSVAKELVKAQREDIVIGTVDGDPKSIELLKENKNIIIDSAQFCGEMGAVALRVTYEKLTGKDISKHILLPVFPITKETQNIYQGWLSPIPNKFKKPWVSITPYWNNQLSEK